MEAAERLPFLCKSHDYVLPPDFTVIIFDFKSLLFMKLNYHLLLGVSILLFACKKNGPKVYNIAIDQQNAYGGNLDEYLNGMAALPNNDIVSVGWTTTNNDGDVGPINGNDEAWIIRTNTSGNKVWAHTYGGGLGDYFNHVISTADNGILAVGSTRSNDGDIHPDSANGNYDAWVVKLNGSNGNIEWQRNLGGSNSDKGICAIQTRSGNYIIAGYTNSNDGDVHSGNKGGEDVWVIKLSPTGSIIWEKTYGGSSVDRAGSMILLPDDNVLLASNSGSRNGDVPDGHGLMDIWVKKINTQNGSIIWKKSIGGQGEESVAFNSLTRSSDGEYIIAGQTRGIADGDLVGTGRGWPVTQADICVFKCKDNGAITWVKRFGGEDDEIDGAVLATSDGGVVISTTTISTSGDITTPYGSYDIFVFQLDAAGNKLWQKTFGGTSADFARAVIRNSSGKLILGNDTESNDHDVSGNHSDGYVDFWIVKLKGD